MNNLKIGSFLQALRKSRGLTQAELAEYFEVSSKTVSKWECGDALPEISMLKALAEYYDVTVDEILNGEMGVKRAEKTKKDNEKYFYSRAMKKLEFFSLISYSVLLFAFLLLFIIAHIAKRFDIACVVSISITYASGAFYIIGVFLAGKIESDFDEKLIHKYKTKKFWLLYGYIVATIYVTCCALLCPYVTIWFLIILPCLVTAAGIFPLFKFFLWDKIIKIGKVVKKNKQQFCIFGNICIDLFILASIIVLFVCSHIHYYYTYPNLDRLMRPKYIWNISHILGWIGIATIILAFLGIIILKIKKKNLVVAYFLYLMGFVLVFLEMILYSKKAPFYEINKSLAFYYIFLFVFSFVLIIIEAIKFFNKHRHH